MKPILRRILTLEKSLPVLEPESFLIDGLSLDEILLCLFEDEKSALFSNLAYLIEEDRPFDDNGSISALVALAKQRVEKGLVVKRLRRSNTEYWSLMKMRRRAGLPDWQSVSSFEERLMPIEETESQL